MMGPGIHMHAIWTSTINLNIVAARVHPFMTMALSNASGLFQKDNSSYHTAIIAQEWVEEHDKGLKASFLKAIQDKF